jgi:hypothetical protein
VVGGEHHAKRAHRRIELAVQKGKRLGVGFTEGDLQPVGLSALFGAGEQGRDVVDAGDPTERRAAARLAVPLPQATSSTLSPARRSIDSQSSSGTMVVVPTTAIAAGPGGLLAGLDRGEIRPGGGTTKWDGGGHRRNS